MSLPEKEGFELSTSSAKPSDDYAVPPLQNCNKGRSDSGFAVFSMGKEISFLFFASSARRSGSIFSFENKKRHPCKFLSELQALMSLPEKEGFELSTSSAKPSDDYAVPPLQNCNKGRSDSGFAVFSMGKEISFLFFASSARRSGSIFSFENKKRHPCKFLSELQALMSLPEKEGFERPTSKHGRLFSIPLVSRQTPCFSHLPPPSSCPRQRSAEDPTPRGALVPSFLLKTKKDINLS